MSVISEQAATLIEKDEQEIGAGDRSAIMSQQVRSRSVIAKRPQAEHNSELEQFKHCLGLEDMADGQKR